MNKDDITFAIVGIVLGLIFGFFAGNWSQSSTTPTGATNSAPQTAAPSGGASGTLPPQHPTVDPDKPVQARPLTPEQIQAAQNAPGGGEVDEHGHSPDFHKAEGGVSELPSIEPLPASSKEERAEQKYKNIQVLKGIAAEELEKVMFAFKDSLGVECTYCHVPDHFERDDKQNKKIARQMIVMMRETNQRVAKAVGEAERVTCFTCHRGQQKPAS